MTQNFMKPGGCHYKFGIIQNMQLRKNMDNTTPSSSLAHSGDATTVDLIVVDGLELELELACFLHLRLTTHQHGSHHR